MDHSSTERLEIRFPASLVFLPQKILYRDSAQMRTRDAQAVDPASEAALDSGMPDIVIHADRLRIEILEYNVQVPDGSPHQSDAGMRVVHGACLILCVERGQFGDTRFQLLELFGHGTIRIVPEIVPAVVVDSELGHHL